jgi:hypothetical protein
MTQRTPDGHGRLELTKFHRPTAARRPVRHSGESQVVDGVDGEVRVMVAVMAAPSFGCRLVPACTL